MFGNVVNAMQVGGQCVRVEGGQVFGRHEVFVVDDAHLKRQRVDRLAPLWGLPCRDDVHAANERRVLCQQANRRL